MTRQWVMIVPSAVVLTIGFWIVQQKSILLAIICLVGTLAAIWLVPTLFDFFRQLRKELVVLAVKDIPIKIAQPNTAEPSKVASPNSVQQVEEAESKPTLFEPSKDVAIAMVRKHGYVPALLHLSKQGKVFPCVISLGNGPDPVVVFKGKTKTVTADWESRRSKAKDLLAESEIQPAYNANVISE